MTKTTAIIDIGSNSARLVVFEQSSKFGYRLICEQKSKVRIGEGAYDKGGNLQSIPLQRAFNALKSFKYTIEKNGCKKIVCVATSALRDAPNKNDFISKVKLELGIDILVISGLQEAKYGGIAASNLLTYEDCISIDIGGGSSDLALIRNGQVVETFSLDIGTVRIKELFFDKNKDIKEAREYIKQIVQTLPKTFSSNIAIGIGGTARTIASSIIAKNNYPIDKLHSFRFRITDELRHLQNITTSKIKDLDSYFIKQNRHDTIREGIIIFIEIVGQLKSNTIITSSAGVRDGVYLDHMFGGGEARFPQGINPSLESILDRFSIKNHEEHMAKIETANILLDLFMDKLDTRYVNELKIALQLSDIGHSMDIYSSSFNSSYIALHELYYGFTHEQIIFISMLLLATNRGKIKKVDFKRYKPLLPIKDILWWHSFIYAITVSICKYTTPKRVNLTLENKTLIIKSEDSLYLLREDIDEMKIPRDLDIKIYFP